MDKSVVLKSFLVAILSFTAIGTQRVAAQQGERPLHIFGYYQNSFEKYTNSDITNSSTTFLTQQLNLVVQKDLSSKFRSFVNFEFLNSFEGSLGWGSASLKEAWVRYDLDARFKLKIGLHIPTFNHLNDIKISTPLLPYVVRPIVYETSLQDVMDIESFVPERAFIQAYGAFNNDRMSYLYAVYLGNSPNINTDRELGQTGVDSTRFMLVGGRLGLQWDNPDSPISEFRLGVSSTLDKVNAFQGVADLIAPYVDDRESVPSFTELTRWRMGSDLGLYWNRWVLHAEVIKVIHAETTESLDINKLFAYATLGYILSDRWDIYLSTWYGREFGRVRDRVPDAQYDLKETSILNVYTGGVRFSITPRLMLKGQIAVVTRDHELDVQDPFNVAFLDLSVDENTSFAIYGLALSVFF